MMILSFSGCHNMCNELEETIGKECWTDKLQWIDASQNTSISSGASTRFSSALVDGRYVITGKGSGGNWVFSGLGRDIKGFEGQVKLDTGVSQAGFEIFAKDSYKKYLFTIKKDGSLNIAYNDGTENSTNVVFSSKSKIVDKVNEYNTIKAELLSNRSTRVSVNGVEVCTIPDHTLHYGIITTCFSGSGTCYFKIQRVQK